MSRCETELVIRFDYGVTIPWVNRVRQQDHHRHGGSASALRAHAGQKCRARTCIRSPDFSVKKGERVPFVLSYRRIAFRRCPKSIDADIALEETERHWADWTAICQVKGKWRNQVMRSLLTLKSLSYEPTGGIVAAVTTSLAGTDRRHAQLGLSLLLAAGRHLHAAGLPQRRLHRGGQCLAALADAGDRRRAGPASDHVQRDGRPAAGRVGDFRICRATRIPDRCGSAMPRPSSCSSISMANWPMSVAQARKGGLPPVPRAGRDPRNLPGASGKDLARAGRRHLGNTGRAAALRPFQGDDLGGVRPRQPVAAQGQARQRAHYRKAGATAFTRTSAPMASTPNAAASFRPMARVCMDASLLLLPLVGFLPASDRRIRRTVEEIEKRLHP